jgi:hypothetical protein
MEDDWHVVADCTVSMQARQAASLDMQLMSRFQNAMSARELIFDICSHEDKDTAGMFAMVVWSLWNN